MSLHILSDVITHINEALSTIAKNKAFSQEEKSSLKATASKLNGLKSAISKCSFGPLQSMPMPAMPYTPFNNQQQPQHQCCKKDTKVSMTLILEGNDWRDLLNCICLVHYDLPKERKIDHEIIFSGDYYNAEGGHRFIKVKITGYSKDILEALTAAEICKTE